jgi:hypothetical protein
MDDDPNLSELLDQALDQLASAVSGNFARFRLSVVLRPSLRAAKVLEELVVSIATPKR